VEFHDRAHDRQPEPDAIDASPDSIRSATKRREQGIPHQSREARPSVGNLHPHHPRALGDQDVNPRARPAVLTGVDQQIDECLPNAPTIGKYRPTLLALDHSNPLTALSKQWLDNGRDIVGKLRERDRSTIDAESTFAQRRRAEQVLNESLKPDRAPMHRLSNTDKLVAAHLIEVFEDKL